jgi:hypothetical protein
MRLRIDWDTSQATISKNSRNEVLNTNILSRLSGRFIRPDGLNPTQSAAVRHQAPLASRHGVIAKDEVC